MKQQLHALQAELIKIKYSKIILATFIAFGLAPIMGGVFILIVQDSEALANAGGLAAKAKAMKVEANWRSYFDILTQSVGVGGVLVFGFVSSWIFGREYSDGTAKDLISLPTSRTKILNAKFILYILWCLALVISNLLIAFLIGKLINLPEVDSGMARLSLNDYFITTILTILVGTPIAFFALYGKGYLAPLGFVALTLVFAQVIAATGYGSYFPWSIPGLYSGAGGAYKILLNNFSYAILILTGIAGYLTTIIYWKFAEIKQNKMKKHIYLFVLCLQFLLIATNLFAQKNNTSKNDSLNSTILSEYNKNLKAQEVQRIVDSVKKSALETQILTLKASDNAKRDELQKELEELNNKETKRLKDKKSKIDSLRLTAKSYPVHGFFTDTLFSIYSKLGSFSAYDRAIAIESKIKSLTDIYRFKTDSIKIVETESTTDLLVGETIIISISEDDALWNNSTKLESAKLYKEVIGHSIMRYQSETSLSTLAKEIGLAMLVLLAMGLLIYYIGKLFNWIAEKIKLQKDKLIKGIKIKNYVLFDAKREVNVLLSANTFLKWFIILLIVYIALPIIFGIFPWTKHFTETLFGYILNPAKHMVVAVWNYLPNLITIIVIVFIFRYALKGVRFLKSEIEKGKLQLPGFYPDWANPTYQIIKVVIYAFMGIVIFPYLPGSDSPVFQGVSVFLGVLFTFGSSGSLSNVVAGLVLTYMRLFKIGDRVKIGEVVGDIIEKSLLVTRIRTIKNEIISIPNSTVMSSHTINYSSDAVDNGLIIHTTVTIGYDVPWKDMHDALILAAERTNLLLKDPKSFVLQTSLDDFYVSYQINAYTKEPNKQATIYSDLHANIQDCCNEAGIEILSPHYRAERDGNMITIPANYLKKNYKAPSFNIKIEKEEK